MDGGTSSPSRSAFLGRTAPMRPPGTDETRIRAHCTSCGECIRACPEAILIPGPARTPVVDFSRGGCTFCNACSEACDEAVFDDRSEQPWGQIAVIGEGCLLTAGISCQTCTDACDAEALTFDLSVRPVGAVRIDASGCTGCGFCLSACPVSAIKISPDQGAHQ